MRAIVLSLAVLLVSVQGAQAAVDPSLMITECNGPLQGDRFSGSPRIVAYSQMTMAPFVDDGHATRGFQDYLRSAPPGGVNDNWFANLNCTTHTQRGESDQAFRDTINQRMDRQRNSGLQVIQLPWRFGG